MIPQECDRGLFHVLHEGILQYYVASIMPVEEPTRREVAP